MGIFDKILGGRISNPALLSAVAAYQANSVDDNLVGVWQKMLKSKVLLATSPDAAKSFSKIKQIRDAISIPFKTDSNAHGDIFLAIFSDHQTFEQSLFNNQTPVIVTGEQAFILASSKGLLGLVINPKSSSGMELKIWQHLIFIEKLGECNKLNALATKLARSGNHADAEGVLKGAIAAAQRDPGPTHPVTAELNIELAKALRMQNKLNEAEWVYKRALGIYESCGSHDLEIATTSEALALLYVENNKAALSVPLFVRALDILECVPGAKPDSIGRMLCQLAEIKMQENQHEEAETYFKRACLSLEEKKHPEVVAVSNKLGAMLEIISRPRDAVAQYARSLLLPESIKRCKPADISFAAYRSAMICLDEGKLAEAENFLHRALDGYRADNSTADIDRTLDQLEEVKELIAEQNKKKEEEAAAQSTAKGKFGSPGRRAPELLDFAAIKNAAKATYEPGQHAQKQKPQADAVDPEEQALALMRDFLNSVENGPPGSPAAEIPVPSIPEAFQAAVPPPLPELPAPRYEEAPLDVELFAIPAPEPIFEPAADLTSDLLALAPEPEPEPNMQELLDRACNNINRAESALEQANQQLDAPMHEDEDLDTDSLFALAKQSNTGLKPVSEQQRIGQENARISQNNTQIDAQIDAPAPDLVEKPIKEVPAPPPATINSGKRPSEFSIPPAVPKPDQLAPAKEQMPAAEKADAKSTKSFGKQIAGEISSVFNKSIFGNAAKSDRFDRPISKGNEPANEVEANTSEESVTAGEAPAAANDTTAPPVSQPAMPQSPNSKSLFGAPVDAEISQVFDRSVLGEMRKSDRFDNPIPRKSAAPESASASPPEATAAASEAAIKPAPAKADVETKTTRPAEPPICQAKEKAGNGLFDEEIDSSLTDAFNSMMLSPQTAPDPYEKPIQERLAAGTQPESAADPAVEPAPEPANAASGSLFSDELDSSLNDAFASLSSEPMAGLGPRSDRYDTPIQARLKTSQDQPALNAAAQADSLQVEPAAPTAPPPAITSTSAPAAAQNSEATAACRTPEDLIKLLEQQLQADPENSDLWLRKGTALVQQQRLDEAIKVFDKVTSMRPNDIKAWYCKGSSLHLKNQFEDALYCFNHVLNLDKENVKAMLRKAECLFKLGRADQGMVIYDRILLLQPKFVPGWLSKARALLQQRKLDDAKSCYEQVLVLDPVNEEAIKANNLIISKLGAAAGS